MSERPSDQQHGTPRRLSASVIEGWKRDGAAGVDMRKYIFAHEWATLCDLALKGLSVQSESASTPNAARYEWLRKNGDKAIYVLRAWKQGDDFPPLKLAQGDELDTIIDEHISGKRP